MVLMFYIISTPNFAMASCDYYASPSGSGNGASISTPFQISNFWSVASAGDILCLLDGTYTGSNSMIAPPTTVDGTAGNPITIKALNDGEVNIDGQGVRGPVVLSFNDYFVLEGFNAHDGTPAVFDLSNSDNNIMRRVIGWNANRNENVGFVFTISHGENNLIEDCAAFGTARKVIGSTQDGNYTTIRRCWARWEGSDFTGPKETLTAGYFNYNMTTENFIGTWSGEEMSGSTDQPFGVIANDNDAAFSKILGTMMYIRSTDSFPAGQVSFLQGVHDFTLKDVVVYNEKNTIDNLFLGTGSDNTDLSASQITVIGAQSAQINAVWNPTDIINASSVSNANSQGANLFTGTNGAQMCYRYRDGVLSGSPLWPWPMNQRIIDATTDAGKTPIDVTSTVTSIFGSIAQACKSTLGGPYVTIPIGSSPTIDGALTEFTSANSFAITSEEGNVATVKMMWDTNNLYIGVTMTDTDLIATTTSNDASGIFNDDSIEIAFDTQNDNGNDADDYKIVINAQNATWDENNTSISWNGPFDHAVSRSGTLNNGSGDTSWNIEISLPWSSIGVTPSTAATYAMNFRVNNNDTSIGKRNYIWYGEINSERDAQDVTLEAGEDDTTDPVVTITAPTSNTTYSTATTPITTIAGTATDAVGTTSVTWANAATSGSGSASGCSGQTSCNWSVSSISLNEGSNAITVTGTDAASNEGTDTITVTLDSTAPSRSNGSPSGTLAAGTTSTAISLTTNETATCKYGTTASVAYASQPNTFFSTNSTSHSTTVSSLSDGNSYTYYVRCQDSLSNANTSDFSISFSVNARPSRSNGSPSGALASGTTQTSMSLTTNETATCKYGTSAGVAYASLPNTFSSTNSTSHSTTVSGLSDGNSYAYYVRCQDIFGDPNTDDFTISFSVDEPELALPGVPTSLSDSASSTPSMPGVPTSLSSSVSSTPGIPGAPTSLSDSANNTPAFPGAPTNLSL